MSEITEDGYQSLRELACAAHTLPNRWDYLAIYDSNIDEVTRVSVTNDSRFYWDDLDGDSILQVRGEVTGSDSDIPTDGTKLTYVAMWDSATGGRQITHEEQVAGLTFNQTGDKMDITHNIELPQVI